ncbi:MAG: hypothetical protein PVI79_09140 [Gammaproteobacteria bacterium]|jgi:hypothetical protein
MQSVDELSEAAQIAYRAFVDMSASKDEHFALLKSIEQARLVGEPPGLGENLELEKLLAVHDRNVLAFKTAMAEVTDEDEIQALVRLMS